MSKPNRDLKVEYLPIGDLIPYARNSRTHSESQVAQIAASIREFGFTNPVLVSENRDIIAGHGRVLAAQKLKMEAVPCITLKGLTEAQRRAYVIADNKLAINAGWDIDLLKVEIEELHEVDFDIDLLGFDRDELKSLLSLEDEVEDTKEVEPPEREFIIVVNLRDESEQQALFEELQGRGLECKIMS